MYIADWREAVDNALIADFLGWEHDGKLLYTVPNFSYEYWDDTDNTNYRSNKWRNDTMLFHVEDGWVKLAIDKIQSMGYSVGIITEDGVYSVEIKGEHLYYKGIKVSGISASVEDHKPIAAAYSCAVVNFLRYRVKF